MRKTWYPSALRITTFDLIHYAETFIFQLKMKISSSEEREIFFILFYLNFSIPSRIQTLRFHTSLLRIQTTINEMWQITFRKPIKKQYTFHLKLFPQRERHLSSLTVDERNSIGEEDNWRRFDVLKCIFGKSDNDSLQEMRFFFWTECQWNRITATL